MLYSRDFQEFFVSLIKKYTLYLAIGIQIYQNIGAKYVLSNNGKYSTSGADPRFYIRGFCCQDQILLYIQLDE